METKIEEKVENKNNDSMEPKLEEKVENKNNENMEPKLEEKVENKNNENMESKLEEKVENKNNENMETKIEEKVENKNNENIGEKSYENENIKNNENIEQKSDENEKKNDENEKINENKEQKIDEKLINNENNENKENKENIEQKIDEKEKINSQLININDIDINKLKIQYKDRDLYPKEVLDRVKRNKELRDLFYNKVQERQYYLHKCFTKFYYRGLILYFINKYSPKKPIDNNIEQNNSLSNLYESNEKKEENNNETNNDNNNLESINEVQNIKRKVTKEIYEKSRRLRKFLAQKNRQKIQILQKYFYRFQHAGIIVFFRQSTRRATIVKKMDDLDLQQAINTVANNSAYNEIKIDENTNVENFQEALNKKMEDKDFAKEVEKIKLEEEKMKQNEKAKDKEIQKERLEKLGIIFNKLDVHNRNVLKNKFEILNLKTKVLSLTKYERKRAQTVKKKKKKKASTNNSANEEDQIKRVETVKKTQDEINIEEE
jgi:hypothetical protein